MICARIESLILEQGMEDALERAFAFSEVGADANIENYYGMEYVVLPFCSNAVFVYYSNADGHSKKK